MRVEHIGNATLILADCMDIMRDMPDKAFDLAIVDPPYGINADVRQNEAALARIKADGKSKAGRGWKLYKQTGWDSGIPKQKYWDELFRVSKNQIIWGGNYFTDFLPASMGWVVWNKGQRGFSLADGELAWTSLNVALRIFDYSRAEALQDGRIHPTQKPVALYKWLLSRYAKDGDTILDTHGGSGSSVIACLDMGYSITWIEKDVNYFEAALKRIKDFAAQPKLPMDDTPEPVEQWLGFEEEL